MVIPNNDRLASNKPRYPGDTSAWPVINNDYRYNNGHQLLSPAGTPRDLFPNDESQDRDDGYGPLPIISSRSSILLDAATLAEEQDLIANAGEEYHKIWADVPDDGSSIVDIPPDCWGSLIWAIVCDVPDLVAGRLNREGKVRVSFILAVWTINLLAQGTLLYFVVKLLMLPGVLAAQDVYKEFHKKAFVNGQFDNESWMNISLDKKVSICELALAQRFFVRVILFLWVTKNFGELKINQQQRDAIARLPVLPEGKDSRLMVRDHNYTPDTTTYMIICLDNVSKVLLNTFVYLPKIVISVALMLCGCYWLLAAEGIGDLILNSLALAFVVEVDELIAVVFFPHFFYKEIMNLVIALPADPDDEVPETASKKRENQFLMNALTLFLAVVTVEVVIRYQQIIPGYEEDVSARCVTFLNSQVPWCWPWSENCFPFGTPDIVDEMTM